VAAVITALRAQLVTPHISVDREVVIAVGGFLGLEAKLVTVPFDQLRFERSANNPPAPATGSAPAYFSVVLPGATKDSLTKMGEFKFAV
jgi:hypothetical protein